MGVTFFRAVKGFFLSQAILFTSVAVAQDVFITVDQFGYRPSAKKIAVLRSPERGYDASLSYTPGTTMEVVDSATLEVVFSGTPVAFQEGAIDTASGDKIWWFDFSTVTTPGTYYVRDRSDYLKQSFYFHIKDDVYNDILKAAMRMMFYQRVGMAKEAKYAGEDWADAINHEQDKWARLFTDSTNASTERDVSGGWFDAGDLNKYTIWNGNYIEMLLRAYMDNPKAFTDDYNIPESGNGIPDILDEVKWGMDHLLRMQNADGSVLSVVDEDHASPPSAAQGRSYYGAPNAMSAYSATKAFAIGSIVADKRGNTSYAATLRDAAQRAFEWAEAHPDSMFYNNKAEYGTKDLAAGQQEIDANYTTGARFVVKVAADFAMYELTGDANYLKRFETTPDSLPLMRQYGSWALDQYRINHCLLYILYLGYKDANAETKSLIQERFVSEFPKGKYIAVGLENDGYRAYIRDYNWGSNSAKASSGLLFEKMGNSDAAEEYLHYLHGVNPFGMVYLSNMGSYGASKSATLFYHTWFGENPAPGYVTGGANSRYTWADCCKQYDADNSAKGCGSASNNALCYAVSIPVGEPPEKMYSNINDGWPIDSWELTEPSLGYQTYYIRLISNFVQERGVDIDERFNTTSSSSDTEPEVSSSSATNIAESSSSVQSNSSTISSSSIQSSSSTLSSSSSSKENSESLMFSGTVVTSVQFVRNALLVNVSRESVIHIQIFDIHGNKVKSVQEQILGNQQISLESLPQGYYVARITSEKSAKSVPFAIR